MTEDGTYPRSLTGGEIDTWRSVWQAWLEPNGVAHPAAPDDKPRVRLLAKLVTGTALDQSEERMVTHWDHARRSYRRCAEEMAARAPGCAVMKGSVLSGLYPEGWTRISGDLDVHAPTREHLWSAAAVLQEEGYDLDSALALKVGEEPALGFTFLSVCPDCGGKLEVGLMEPGFLGDPSGVAPRRDLPAPEGSPNAVQIVPMLWEAFERPFTLRDVFDVWLIAEKLSDTPETLWSVVDEVALWTEYQQLVEVGKKLGAPVPPSPPDLGARVTSEHGARQSRRRDATDRRAWWAYVGGRRALNLRYEWGRRLASAAVRWFCPPARVYAAGLPVCGARLDPTPRDLDFHIWDGRFAADTPLGRFEFTHVPDLVV